LVQLIEGCGVVAEGTVQGLGTDCAFLYDSGAKNLRQVVTTGNLTDGEISAAIGPDIVAEISAGAGRNFASAHYPALGFYLVLLGDKIRIFSYARKPWAQIVGAGIYGMFNGTDGKVYFTGNGHLYQFGVSWTFNGRLPYMLWETAWMSPASRGEKFYPKLMEVLCRPGSITTVDVDVSFDGKRGEFDRQSFSTPGFSGLMDVPVPDTWDNCFLMDGTDYEPVRLPMFGGGRSMKLSFSNQTDKNVEISDIIIPSIIGRL